MVPGSKPPYVPRVNWVNTNANNDTQQYYNKSYYNNDNTAPYDQSDYTASVNAIRAGGNAFHPPQPFVPSNGGQIHMIRAYGSGEDSDSSIERSDTGVAVEDQEGVKILDMNTLALLTPVFSRDSEVPVCSWFTSLDLNHSCFFVGFVI